MATRTHPPLDSARASTAVHSTPAAWWPRAAAWIIDAFLVAMLELPLRAVAGLPILWFRHHSIARPAETLGIAIVASLLYYPLIMVKTDGRTLGKTLLGLRVIRMDGERIGASTAISREAVFKEFLLGLLLLPSVFHGIPGYIAAAVNYLWPLVNSQNRAGHDVFAGTRVVNAR